MSPHCEIARDAKPKALERSRLSVRSLREIIPGRQAAKSRTRKQRKTRSPGGPIGLYGAQTIVPQAKCPVDSAAIFPKSRCLPRELSFVRYPHSQWAWVAGSLGRDADRASLYEMARNSVALNLGAGERPGTSRVAEFLACFLSELVWYGPCNPYVQKTPAPSPARVLRWGRGRKGAEVFGRVLLHLTVFKINCNRTEKTGNGKWKKPLCVVSPGSGAETARSLVPYRASRGSLESDVCFAAPIAVIVVAIPS